MHPTAEGFCCAWDTGSGVHSFRFEANYDCPVSHMLAVRTLHQAVLIKYLRQRRHLGPCPTLPADILSPQN